MDNLGDINTEIERLKQKRADLLNRRQFESEEEIRDLEWTKECHARLEINQLATVGLPAYSIHVYGKKLPHTVEGITVMGESRLYEENMLFGGKSFTSNNSTFYTSSEKMLLEFLQKVEFKKLDFDERALRVLLAAKEVKERYEKR